MFALDECFRVCGFDDEEIWIFGDECELFDVGDGQVAFQTDLSIEVAEALWCQQNVGLKLQPLNVNLRPLREEVLSLTFHQRYWALTNGGGLGTLLLLEGISRYGPV